MVFLTFREFFDIVAMTLALGYIFSGVVPIRVRSVMDYYKQSRFGLDWESIKYGIIVTAPAVVFHELGHKFTAMAMGYSAEFFTYYWGLGLGVFLKIIGSPFLVFIPGYVSIGNAPVLASGIIALAGPLVNGILWLAATIMVKKMKLKRQSLMLLYLTKRINGILFIFNMIPLGFFDGGKVLQALLSLF